MALLLRKHGIKHIRPLEGGLDAWRDHGFPMDTITVEKSAVTIEDSH